jgi:hypothetical protein
MAQAPLADIVGLKALAKDLAKMSDPRAGIMLKAMAQAGKESMDPIANAVRSAYPSLTGGLRGSVRTSGSRSGAAVRVGTKAKVPYAGPVDFGGYPGERPYIADGRYLYPTAKSLLNAAVQRYEQAIDRVCSDYQWSNPTANPGSVHD